MTPQITSLTQAMDLCREQFTKIREISPGAYIGGGYLRDADLGVQPKDIDYFLWVENQGALDIQLAQITEATGHTFRRLGNALEAEAYPAGLQVYESETKPEDEFPVNLIFAVNSEHPAFDLGLCEIYWWAPNDGAVYRSQKYREDVESDSITVINWTPPRTRDTPTTKELYEGDVAHTIGHIRRVLEKYPDRKVLVDSTALPNHTRWFHENANYAGWGYDLLIKENIIGNPGEVLPPEGQEPDGNPVGQQDGTADLAAIETRLAARGAVNIDDAIRAAEAFAGFVRDQPQVQTRPVGDFFANVRVFDDVQVVPAPGAIDAPNGW